MTDLRPLKPRRFGDGGLMVTVTGFQSVTAGSPACCEGASEQVSSCDKELLSGITTGASPLCISVPAATCSTLPARSRGTHPDAATFDLQQRRVIALKYAADIETLNQGEPGP